MAVYLRRGAGLSEAAQDAPSTKFRVWGIGLFIIDIQKQERWYAEVVHGSSIAFGHLIAPYSVAYTISLECIVHMMSKLYCPFSL